MGALPVDEQQNLLQCLMGLDGLCDTRFQEYSVLVDEVRVEAIQLLGDWRIHRQVCNS